MLYNKEEEKSDAKSVSERVDKITNTDITILIVIPHAEHVIHNLSEKKKRISNSIVRNIQLFEYVLEIFKSESFHSTYTKQNTKEYDNPFVFTTRAR